ncbi:S-type pyocin domain-containing protein [Serratia entomophila]|uniref:S-type pyocin domain-containing protein n=4 Tax=Serratia entomophila TaxID=42906 RepID=A0ABY5D0S6_9GAMM|nr:S-type pyocin domain-containing protein [Serratia entomophila]UIW20660.1 S-type pyocin domain-containing protein [Serratia entomophila]USV03201.1 S-type pyocin domain-containing protein [Serratia entomophila]CAI0801674.1 Colicin-D [Serratia entomophila]CAI0860887.1 Colicin-D [Serratia entomophila]CAI2077526.1 Colicin-D [Serratia entomophila]
MTSVNLPVRGFITTDDNGSQRVNFVRTGVGGVSPGVPIFRTVRDEQTGLDTITLPAIGDVPARTILINPVPTGPAAPSHTGNGSPVPASPVHTGTDVRQADSIVVTTFPADVVQDLQDFILWQPDATEAGVEAIYVMVSDPLDSGRFTRKQLDKKYLKHASDFGINDTKKNRETLTKFRDALEAHLEDKGTVEKGTYLLVEDSKVFFNYKTNKVVVTSKDGSFISGWKLDVNSQQYKNYIEKGILR